ncbi:lambda family phage tail tape measure protein [Azotobacter chroococcum]|uniref:Lambda family phage tail tape measure protein n=2 Tax=Azotobacter chroococcum TaxID=353 RepID=A0A4R1PH24_9GAMM|nr:lambda family phage tail tape measure protein [Azotobacter chroococcum]
MQRAGLSAGQYEQAMRMLPMQLTDVAVSIASGMPIWMVAIQQGGQVRDSFGGIGNAARAVVSTLGPLNLAFGGVAATLGALLLAYQQGQNEAQAYQQALAMTGNAAGTSADQLANMAQAMDEMGGTQRQAAAALTEVAATGKFASDQIQLIAQSAIDMERATGRAVSETVKEFAKLADEPSKAAATLNEQYNFLTGSVYEQIRALEEQGRTTEAAKLATDTYAAAVQQRAAQVEGSLGLLQRGWRSVTSAAAEAWDAMLNVGRPDTLEEQLAAVEERIKTAQSRTGMQASRGASETMSGLEQERTRLLLLKEQRDTEAAWQGELAGINRDSVDSQQKLNAALDRSASNADKLKQRYREIDEQVKAAAETGVIYSEAQIRQLREAAEKQFSDPAPRRQRAFTDDAATRMLQQLREQEASLQAQLAGNDKLTAAQRAQVEWAQQLADLKEKKILTADQKSLLANQGAITAQLAENAALEEQIKARDRLAEQAQWMATLQERVGNRQNAVDIAVQGVGLGDRARQELEQVNAIQREYAKSREELARQQGTANGLPEDQFKTRIDALRAAEEQEIAIIQEGAQRKKEAEADWTNGLSSAWQNYLDEQTSVAAQSEQLFATAFGGMEEALFGFVTTGKLSFQDLQKAFVGTALQMLIRWATAQVSMAALNAFTSMAATPIVGPFAAPAAAATAAASAATFAADIASVAGMAHDGIDSVPREGTWLLDKGERVVDSRTNQDLKQYLSGQQQGAGGMNVVVNNYSNSRVETQRNRSGELEVVIRAVEDRLVGGIAAGDSRLGTVMERSYGMQRQGR